MKGQLVGAQSKHEGTEYVARETSRISYEDMYSKHTP